MRNSGFAVHNRTTVYPDDTEGLNKLACYLMRAPVNLSRLRFDPDSGLLLYQPKTGNATELDSALTDPLEFLARVLIHIGEPSKHLVYFYGAYANRVRRVYQTPTRRQEQEKPNPTRRGANRRWRELIYRIYEVDPSTCDRWIIEKPIEEPVQAATAVRETSPS